MSTSTVRSPASFAANGTQARILHAVRERSPISRTGIVEATGLPHAATSRAVAVLLQEGVLIEIPYADTQGPRRKKGLAFNPAKGYCVAVEYGPAGFEAVALNTAYEEIASARKEMDLAPLPRADKIEAIGVFLEEFLRGARIPEGPPLRIALVDPGIVDTARGVTVESSMLEDWHAVPMRAIFEREFGCPVELLSSSQAKIRAVDRLEVGGGVPDLLHIEYGEGIGCGLKLGGQYVAGAQNLAGELGHMRVAGEDAPCRCGAKGCLEAIASLPAIAAQARKQMPYVAVSAGGPSSQINGMEVLEAFEQGDALAGTIVRAAFRHLAQAAGGIINVVNPAVCVLDHRLGSAGPRVLAAFLEALERSTLPAHWQALDVRVCGLDAYIGPLGGAAAVLDRCLDAP